MKKEIQVVLIGSIIAAGVAVFATAADVSANIALTVAAAPNQEAGVEEKVMLKGTIEVRNGDVPQILLRVNDEEAYFILSDENGQKLVALAGQKVKVKAVKTDRGLAVIDFKPLKANVDQE